MALNELNGIGLQLLATCHLFILLLHYGDRCRLYFIISFHPYSPPSNQTTCNPREQSFTMLTTSLSSPWPCVL